MGTKSVKRVSRPARNETAGRILDAALDVFSERGFDGTGTREIASRAGVNLGLIKYYFDSKEKLWKAAVDEVVAKLGRTVAELSGAATGDSEVIPRAIRECVRFAARNPAFIRLMNDECKRNGPRMRWLVDRHGKRLYELAVGLIESARASHRIPDVPSVHLYYMLLGSIGLIFSQAPECRRLAGADPTLSDAMIETHAEAVVALFLGCNASARSARARKPGRSR